MDGKTKYIEVIYEDSCAEYGAGVIEWLLQSGFAEKEQDAEISANGSVRQRLTARQDIVMNSAVVFVSDEATANRDWHAYIDAIDKDVRLIPVDGGIETADYNDPKVMPSVLEEINFIIPDDGLYSNILDSLTTDPQFYSIKNHLLVKYKSWANAKYEGYLLTKRKDIKKFTAVFQRQYSGQKDPYLKAQIRGILDYLTASDGYAKTQMIERTIRWVKRGALIAGAVAIVLFIRGLSSYYKRAAYTTLVMSVDSDSSDPMTSTIKMLEVFTNPFSPSNTKKHAYEKYVALIDKVWEQNPIGTGYQYFINDAAVPDGSRYVWTADSGGRALLWDTYTGQVESKEKITDGELFCIATSPSGKTAALDDRGRLYKNDGRNWNDSGIVSSVDSSCARMKATDDAVLIYDRGIVELYGAETGKFCPAEDSAAFILDAGIMDDGRILVALSDNGELVTSVWSGNDAPEYFFTGIRVNTRNISDILDDALITTDTTGQVWKVKDRERQRIPLVLPQALVLRFVNDGTVVYHERNIGTGLYDTDEFFDYGNVLSDFRAVNDIVATENMLLMRGTLGYSTVSLEDVLKKESAAAETIYEGRKAAADLSKTGGKGIESIEITDNGIIIVSGCFADGPVDFFLDPSLVLHNFSGHYADRDKEILTGSYSYFEEESFVTEGLPVVVGIRSVPANKLYNADCYYILIGCSDGKFCEFAFSAATPGGVVKTCEHTVPSRTAITAIYQTENGYMLRDAAGRFWNCRSGVNCLTWKGMVESVKAKMHSGVTADLKNLLSSDVWNKLELFVFPGGDGKEWD